jgi:cobalt-zinc-cadmium efflux system protein
MKRERQNPHRHQEHPQPEHRHHEHPHQEHRHQEHSHHHHGIAGGHGGESALLIAVLLTGGFALVEAAGGWWSGSLALLSDSGHMLSDALALGMAAMAARLARRPPSLRHSYGLVRAEVLAAAFNSLLMLVVIIAISVESVQRLLHPAPVAGGAVMLVAALGLLVNVATAVVLARAGDGINTRAALLHVLGDLLGSVAALAAGAIVWFTGWLPADPLLSLLVVLGILVSTLRLLGEATHVLMEGVPNTVNLEAVGQGMAGLRDVRGVHDLHIWMLASGQTALSAHIDIERLDCWPRVLRSLRSHLRHQHGIDHVTLQPECPLPAPQAGHPHIPIQVVAPRRT